VVELPKASGAIDQGAAVYWDDSAKVVTTTATDNTRIGAATEDAASAAATVRVRLNGVFDPRPTTVSLS
jgi:predicted RecA/RadA family phage recombinase